jgi:hypothetical protein
LQRLKGVEISSIGEVAIALRKVLASLPFTKIADAVECLDEARETFTQVGADHSSELGAMRDQIILAQNAVNEAAMIIRRAEEGIQQYLARLGEEHSGGQSPTAQIRVHAPQPNLWNSPEIHDSPNRPDPKKIAISEPVKIHILDGDGHGNGGHLAGTGVPGKKEFPVTWDDHKIIRVALDVAKNPDWLPKFQLNDRWLLRGVREGVTLGVVVEPHGAVVSAYPVSGPGVIRNPKR